MSRRRNNNITGPTSALTEFLRESGITATSIARRVRTQEQSEAGPSNTSASGANQEVAEQPEAGPSRSATRRNAVPTGYGSDDLDEPEEEEEQPTAKKRKLTKAQQAKENAKAKVATKKKGKKGDGDDDNDDEGSDSYNALSRALWSNNRSKPPVGSFETCVKCEKQFTVTKYTMASHAGDGFLCHVCAKASGADPFKKPTKPAVPRKREKRTVVNFEEKNLPSLVSLCVQLISKHIEDVEALGNIGSSNLGEIAKALCRNRTLSPENVALFHDIQNTKLHLSDVTKLTPPSLSALGSLNPNLTSLHLDFCGRIDDSVMRDWSKALPALTRIELLGPFLVKPDAWKTFFTGHPTLEGFLITQSPRFDVDCLNVLLDKCAALKELRLKEVGQMSDEFVEALIPIGKRLVALDLSDPSHSLSDEPLVRLLKTAGKNLETLDLSGHDMITDSFLTDGIRSHAQALRHLRLANTPELSSAGFATLFGPGWDNPALRSIDLSRNPELGAEGCLDALLEHSSAALRDLNINGWKDTPGESLGGISGARELRKLDIGWCREVDNFVMKEILDGCPMLKEAKVFGCNRITVACPRRRGLVMRGVESHLI